MHIFRDGTEDCHFINMNGSLYTQASHGWHGVRAHLRNMPRGRLIEPTYITWRRHDCFCHLSCTACISLTSKTTHTTIATDPNKPVRPTYTGKFTHAPLACLPPPLSHATALQPSILWLLQTLRIPLSMTISMPVHFLMILSTRLCYNATFSILMTSEQNTNSFAFAGTLQ